MIRKDLLKFCKFYKGEMECPKEYDGKTEGQLWFSESIICEFDTDVISKNSEKEFVSYIAAHVGKWDPYGYRETIKFYLEKFDNQQLKEFIIRTYEI
jgi:hypothetical protein